MDTFAERAAKEEFAQSREEHAEWRARRAAGMGFCRLVLIVALGVLLSQVVSGALSALVQFVNVRIISQ